MTSITDHQRNILEAMLLGLDIEFHSKRLGWYNIGHSCALAELHIDSTKLRIKSGQEDNIVTLYLSLNTDQPDPILCAISKEKFDHDTHAIKINQETGSMVGCRI